jgi:segregation and condensation protein A
MDRPAGAAGYVVSTPVYEGPFDLLLHLILKQEVDLWEVRLASIVDAYLAELDRLAQRMERLDLEVATEFLLVAATLVDLKAKRLLPGRDSTDIDEELLRVEERDLLLARLLDCKTFQDAAGSLGELHAAGARRFGRMAGPEEPFRSLAPDPLTRVTVADLAAAAVRALTPVPPPEVRTDHIAPVRASVRDAIETVLALLPTHGTVRFADIARGAPHRLEVVVRFLAVLELYKQGVVELEQPSTFAALLVRPLGPDDVDVDLVALEWDDATAPAPETRP